MKPYPKELRERVVRLADKGTPKAQVARDLGVCRKTVTRYCKAAQGGSLAPKPQGGSEKKLGDDALRKAVKDRPSATLKGHAKTLGVNHATVWRRLRQLGITLKKNS